MTLHSLLRISFIASTISLLVGILGCTNRPNEVASSIRLLTSPNAEIRAKAARQLGTRRSRLAEPNLIQALTDRNNRVRRNAAKALWRIRRDSGNVQPFEWQIHQLSDRLTIHPDGHINLSRKIRFQVSTTYRGVDSIYLFLPRSDLKVRSVKDSKNRPLKFKVDWDYPQPEIKVTGFAKAISGSIREVVIDADLQNLWFADPENPELVRLDYRMGFFNVPVRRYRLDIADLNGARWNQQPDQDKWNPIFREDDYLRSLHWEDEILVREKQRELVLSVVVPRESLAISQKLAPADRPERDLSVALGVFLFFIGLGVGYLVWARKIWPDDWEWHVLGVASLLGMIVLFKPALIEDNLSYYCYARSPVLDGDFNFYDDYLLLNSNRFYFYQVRETPSPVGPSILWAPFILAGHGATVVLNSLGFQFTPHGFSLPYLFMVGVGGFLFTFASLLLSFELAKQYFSNMSALVATLLIAFGSNLLLVFYVWTASSFQPSLFVFSLFLYYWHQTLFRRTPAGWVLLGLLGGLLVQIRFQNGFLLILPFLEFLRLVWEAAYRRQWNGFFKNGLNGIVFLLASLLAFSPQLVLFKAMAGKVFVDTYRVSEEGRFDLSQVWHGITGMFWYGHPRGYLTGLLSGCPVLLVALGGLALVWRRQKWIGSLFILTIVLQTVIVASYKYYYGRLLYVPSLYLVTCSPLFIFGLAAILDALAGRKKFILFSVIFIIPAVARNFYNTYLQLAFKQVDPFPEQLSLVDGLHRLLFLPSVKFRADYVELSGNFGHFLRGFSHGILSLHPIEFWSTLCQWLLLIPLVWLAVVLVRKWISLAQSSSKGNVVRYAATAGVLVLLLLDGLVLWAALRTDNKFTYYRRRLVKKPTSPSVLWGETWSVSSVRGNMKISVKPKGGRKPMSHLHLIGYLRYSEDVKLGSRVAMVRIRTESDRVFNADILAGTDLADIAWERLETKQRFAHYPSGAKVVYDWLLRDGSKYYYWGHAYLCHIKLPEPVRIRSVGILYLQKVGEMVLTDIRTVEPSEEWPERIMGSEIKAVESYRE